MAATCYTVQQVADRWGCAYSSVIKAIKTGGLAAFKIGKAWRIPESAVLAYEAAPAQPQTTTKQPKASAPLKIY